MDFLKTVDRGMEVVDAGAKILFSVMMAIFLIPLIPFLILAWIVGAVKIYLFGVGSREDGDL